MFPITVPKRESIGNTRSAYFRINQLFARVDLASARPLLYAWINLELGCSSEKPTHAHLTALENPSGRDVAWET